MSFTHPHGTRGRRQPRGALVRFGNKMMAGRVRKAGGKKMMGMHLLVLHTVGAKSGQPRQTPVAWFPGPDGSRIIVASANGAIGNPAWYHNLATHPDQVAIEIDGQPTAVIPEQLHGAERAEAWAAVVAAAPRFGDYEHKTDRELPVVRLRPKP
ncbi:nitroreductase/quinone reductase family protein [Nocardioides sp. CER19]|uniref:nitroreductase/quinone reductase family protein n=1 Tax=Nocardioides sp. CER19 TaxID=3038538 RepID=UPI00244B6C4C|nr:nitroreductase/quinone reductase family protein [Nocardioides sp. CER19]MDH2415035.1 nitroreductase/quinone reductase family protein [Nocardioides sp. CER19]